ncbi:hypothetical protein [Flavisphingomonas formosensis]|uniref:hypothetical protein n=1 Tax=Flavisphingomonas formosensis TaxID=861534 RepID=UPI0012F9E407|nr:hypothetical protein [Sphingomonas formosensis]
MVIDAHDDNMLKCGSIVIFETPKTKKYGTTCEFEILCEIWRNKVDRLCYTTALYQTIDGIKQVYAEDDAINLIDDLPDEFRASAKMQALNFMILHS